MFLGSLFGAGRFFGKTLQKFCHTGCVEGACGTRDHGRVEFVGRIVDFLESVEGQEEQSGRQRSSFVADDKRLIFGDMKCLGRGHFKNRGVNELTAE